MNMWACPKCPFRIEQPCGVSEVAHLCGKGKRSVALKMIEPPKVNIRAAIVAEATARFPQEACGFILDTGTIVVAENVAHDPQQNFLIDHATADMWWPTGKVTGVWHSHCFDPAIPSEADQEHAQPGLECWIYSVMDEQLGIYKPDRQGQLQMVAMEDIG